MVRVSWRESYAACLMPRVQDLEREFPDMVAGLSTSEAAHMSSEAAHMSEMSTAEAAAIGSLRPRQKPASSQCLLTCASSQSLLTILLLLTVFVLLLALVHLEGCPRYVI